jgi:hypothetical protein
MSNYILTRIEAIQQELEILKQKVLIQEQRDAPNKVPTELFYSLLCRKAMILCESQQKND